MDSKVTPLSMDTYIQGVTKRCRLSWQKNSTRELKCGGRGGVAGSQLYTGAEINFGDLTPYLTYAYIHPPATNVPSILFSHKRRALGLYTRERRLCKDDEATPCPTERIKTKRVWRKVAIIAVLAGGKIECKANFNDSKRSWSSSLFLYQFVLTLKITDYRCRINGLFLSLRKLSNG